MSQTIRRALIRSAVFPFAALLLVSCGGSSETTAPTASTRELINPDVNYAAASRFENLVFTAGHLPDVRGASFEEQVEDVLDGLEETLKASGAGFDTLLKVNVYLTDFDDWDLFNTVYLRRIGQHGTPPRTTVEVARLGGDSAIEIAAIAHLRSASR